MDLQVGDWVRTVDGACGVIAYIDHTAAFINCDPTNPAATLRIDPLDSLERLAADAVPTFPQVSMTDSFHFHYD